MNSPSKVLSRQFEKAAMYAQQGRFDLALPRYAKLLDRLPAEVELRLQYANALGLSGRRKKAQAEHEHVKKLAGDQPELAVRIGRDLSQWQDYEKSLDVWNSLYEKKSQWRVEAAYYRIFLAERLNRLQDARKAFEEAQATKATSPTWRWQWISGRLLERECQYDEAKQAYHRALAIADVDGESTCRCALARLALRAGSGPDLVKEITQILKLRKTEAAELSEQFSLADHEDIELPPPLEPDSEEPQLIVLAGFPRAGTTLLSRLLAEKFHSVISDEYPYLQQLVSQWGQIGKAFPKPTHVASKPLKLRKKTMNRYWQAQRETLDVGLEPGVLLIDKNPSLANLLPWLIGMAPGLQVIWAQRDPRDLWLSSVTLDAPVNQVNCWWQTPNNFAKWVSNQHSLSMRLEKHLGTSRFQRVDYSELVSSPDLVMQQLGNSLQINENNSPNELAQPRSPSYAEAVEQPHTRASGHWAKVGQSFSSETSAVLEDLARELCYEK